MYKPRLGHDYRDHAPTYVPQHLKKIWFAGSADTDQVLVDCKRRLAAPFASKHLFTFAPQEVRERFADTMAAAAAGKLGWQHGYEALASVILQDQLTRSVCAGSTLARIICTPSSPLLMWIGLLQFHLLHIQLAKALL